jgi:hypothetical protein
MEKEIKENYFEFCLRCGRRLKTTESQHIGMGKVCLNKTKKKKESIPLFDMKKE